jgi:hypothetical protein
MIGITTGLPPHTNGRERQIQTDATDQIRFATPTRVSGALFHTAREPRVKPPRHDLAARGWSRGRLDGTKTAQVKFITRFRCEARRREQER